jgi:mannosyltransferase
VRTILILGNSNKRFSGVTSTMLQVLPEQSRLIETWVMGPHNLPDGQPWLSFWQCLKRLRSAEYQSVRFVFHARRNDEMIQALLLRTLTKASLKIFFTSTAQRFHSGFSRWLMRRMDLVISTCEAAASYLTPAPSILIPHGIDTRRFAPVEDKAAAMATLGYPSVRGVGIFGRVRQQKGVDVFVEALLQVLEQQPQVHGFIVGEIKDNDQPFVEALKTLAAKAGLGERIHFLGKLPFEQLPTWFAAMDVVCALSRNEGFGLTVPEAMASGTAVVASRAGAWPDILSAHRAGELVPCGDVSATAEALQRLLSDHSYREACVAAGLAGVQHDYTVQREAAALVAVARNLASDS